MNIFFVGWFLPKLKKEATVFLPVPQANCVKKKVNLFQGVGTLSFGAVMWAMRHALQGNYPCKKAGVFIQWTWPMPG